MLSKSSSLAFLFGPVLTAGSSFLNFSSPAPYIFSSVNGLLEQWSNSFFPNGHSIAACEVPKHTLLYHGRVDNLDPPSPEWLAFDIEMSYGIMGNDVDSRILTYRTVRAVQCIYFDGTSASLMGSGTEAQMTFLYGNSDSVPSRPGPGRGRGPPGKGHRGGGSPHDGPPGNKRPGNGSPGGGPPNDEPPRRSNSTDDSPRWNPLADEYFRARGLCKWIEEKGLGGLGWGYEGIIRMNAGFEMIWCNFTSPSLQLVSNLNVSAPRLKGGQEQKIDRRPSGQMLLGRGLSPPQQSPLGIWSDEVLPADEGPHGPGMTDPSEPFRGAANWMWFAAAARRYGSSANEAGRGEARARIHICGLFSFYDQNLSDQNTARIQEEREYLNLTANGQWKGPKTGPARKLALEQLMRRRRQHRTNHVSRLDGILMQQNVENNLMNSLNQTKCSGIDWRLITQEIIAAYAQNLHELSGLLASPSDSDIRTKLKKLRIITHWLMLPFFEYPSGPYTNDSLPEDFSIHSPAAQSAFGRCRTQYAPTEGEILSDSEAMISRAVEDTLSAICHTVFEVGLQVEIKWLSEFNTTPKTSGERPEQIFVGASVWKEKIEELNAWLGWVDQWTGCEGCKSGETCYIPMWPVGGWHWGGDADDALFSPKCVKSSSYPP